MSSSQASSRARIRPLPESVTEKLRAGVKIVSPTRCVEELVYNAIDAGADCVAVRLELKHRWKIVVIDNGHGIDEADLAVVGTRYYTSKCSEVEDLDEPSLVYGYRGEALSNIANVSGLLEITSRPGGTAEACTRSFWHGRPWKLQKANEQRPGRGTTVTVVDFFYNLPVRRVGTKPHLEIDYLKNSLERIAVVHPHVSVSLKDEDTDKTYFSTVKCVSVEQAFLRIFGEEAAYGLEKFKYKKEKIKIEGFVRIQPFSNPNLRLLYINKSLLRKSHLNQFVDSLLAKGIFPSETAKYAVYVLNVRCPYSLYELIQDTRTSLIEFEDWNPVQDAFKEAFEKFFEDLKRKKDRKEVDVERNEPPAEEPHREDEEEFCCANSPVHQDPSRFVLGTENFPAFTLPPRLSSRSFKRPPPMELPSDLRLIPTAMQRLSREVRFQVPCSACNIPNQRRRIPRWSSSVSIRAMCSTAAEDWSDLDSDEEISVEDEKKSERLARLSRFMNKKEPKESKKSRSVQPRMVDAATSPFPEPTCRRSGSLPSTSSSPGTVTKRSSAPIAASSSSRSGSPEERSPSFSKSSSSYRGFTKRPRFDESSRESSPTTSACTWDSHHRARLESGPKEKQIENRSVFFTSRTDTISPYFADVSSGPSDRATGAPPAEKENTGEGRSTNGSEDKTPDEELDDSGAKSSDERAPEDDMHSSIFSPPGYEGSSMFSPPFDDEADLAFDAAEQSIQIPSTPPVRISPKPFNPTGNYDCTNSDGELDPDKIDELLRKKFASMERNARELRQDARAPAPAPECETPEAVSFFEKEWANPVFAPDILTKQGSSGPKDSLSFSKEMLDRVYVLGQADEKFIIATIRDKEDVRWLVAIDQHAAHERIRLETFIADYVTYGESEKWTLKSRAVDPPVEVKLPSRLWKVVQSEPSSFCRLGFMWDSVATEAEFVTVPFLHVPAIFVDRNSREVRKGNVDDIGSLCRQLLEEAVEKIVSKEGVASWSVPNTVIDILASRACKGAIKFFDPLTRQECAEILQLLKRCSLPFQCAHGRPSMVPLMNLSAIGR